MKHPIETLSTGALRKLYWVALLLTAVVPLGMDWLAKYSHQDAAPGAGLRTVPTIKFEFANTPDKWNALATDVGAAGLNALRQQTYLDMLFAACYSMAIAVGVIGIARGSANGVVRASAPWVAWGALCSGALDAVENTGMLVNIAGPLSPTWLQITFACAAVKFALVAVGVLFIFFLLPLPWREVPR